MTSFEFFKDFFGSQTVFIGGWGMKFEFFRICFLIFDLKL
jgi:hypothetical protein